MGITVLWAKLPQQPVWPRNKMRNLLANYLQAHSMPQCLAGVWVFFSPSSPQYSPNFTNSLRDIDIYFSTLIVSGGIYMDNQQRIYLPFLKDERCPTLLRTNPPLKAPICVGTLILKQKWLKFIKDWLSPAGWNSVFQTMCNTCTDETNSAKPKCLYFCAEFTYRNVSRAFTVWLRENCFFCGSHFLFYKVEGMLFMHFSVYIAQSRCIKPACAAVLGFTQWASAGRRSITLEGTWSSPSLWMAVDTEVCHLNYTNRPWKGTHLNCLVFIILGKN